MIEPRGLGGGCRNLRQNSLGNNPMNASSNLKALYDVDPDAVHSLFNSALRLCNEDRYDEAEPTLIRFTMEFPDYDHGKPWYELADIHEHKGRKVEADSAYRNALRCEPNFDVYLESFAHFLWRNGKKEEALGVAVKLRALMDTAYAGSSTERIDRFLAALRRGASYEDFTKDVDRMESGRQT
jgi:tetratricopeptide (TPR) repeat protein